MKNPGFESKILIKKNILTEVLEQSFLEAVLKIINHNKIIPKEDKLWEKEIKDKVERVYKIVWELNKTLLEGYEISLFLIKSWIYYEKPFPLMYWTSIYKVKGLELFIFKLGKEGFNFRIDFKEAQKFKLKEGIGTVRNNTKVLDDLKEITFEEKNVVYKTIVNAIEDKLIVKSGWNVIV